MRILARDWQTIQLPRPQGGEFTIDSNLLAVCWYFCAFWRWIDKQPETAAPRAGFYWRRVDSFAHFGEGLGQTIQLFKMLTNTGPGNCWMNDCVWDRSFFIKVNDRLFDLLEWLTATWMICCFTEWNGVTFFYLKKLILHIFRWHRLQQCGLWWGDRKAAHPSLKKRLERSLKR